MMLKKLFPIVNHKKLKQVKVEKWQIEQTWLQQPAERVLIVSKEGGFSSLISD